MRAVRFYDALASDDSTEGFLPMAENHRDTFFYDGIVDLHSHLTEAGFVAQRTIDLLREFSGKPFFVTAAFWGPHHPALPAPEFAGRHDPEAIPPWANVADDLATKPRIQKRYARLLHRRFTDAPWSLWQRVIARHFDFMAMIDAAIGRIHAELVALGRDKDTVVIFTSDHGDTLGCHGGQFDKGPYMYEETYAVPLLVRSPGLVGGRVNGFASNMDVFASALEIAGVPVPAGIDARSFVPLLHGGLSARDCVTAQFYGFDVRGLCYQEMIRAGNHKYVYNPSDTDELYDLASDPAELRNLIDESSAGDTVRELRQRLLAEMRATAAPFAQCAAELMGL
jgi:arylsulfatase A-like enzyme